MRPADPSIAAAGSVAVFDDRPDITEVAVVRLPIADRRGNVTGYELLFANGKDGATPGVNAHATAAMIEGAFADIGLERLTGRHMAWLSVARDFLVAVGSPPVRPDRAILQIAAYPAREDLLEVLRRLSMRGYTIALSDYDGTEDLGELLELCSIVKVPFDRVTGDARAALVAELRARGGQVVATGVDDDLVLADARELGVDLVQGAVLAKPRVVLGRNSASAA